MRRALPFAALLLVIPCVATASQETLEARCPEANDFSPVAEMVCARALRGASSAQLLATLADRWHEGWLASPSVRDLNLDGTSEIIVARAGLLLGWHLDGSIVLRVEVDGRIWASPLVADFDPSRNGLAVAFAERARMT